MISRLACAWDSIGFFATDFFISLSLYSRFDLSQTDFRLVNSENKIENTFSTPKEMRSVFREKKVVLNIFSQRIWAHKNKRSNETKQHFLRLCSQTSVRSALNA